MELEPETPNALEAYIYRGEARAAKGDFDGSEADFELGLALNPKFPITYWLRSKPNVERRLRWHYRDCTFLISRPEGYWDGCRLILRTGHGQARQRRRGRCGGHCDKSLAVHKPEEDGATEIYEVRAIARQLAHDTPGALADLREGTNLHDPYCALWLFLRQAESGQRDDGAKVLSAELGQEAAIEAKQPCLPRPRMVVASRHMLLGKATVAELLAVAGTER